MKLQNLTIIFIIIIIPVILLLSLYISTGIKTIKYQSLYDEGLLNATHDAIYAFELNTTNDIYSNNAETKRNILKSSIKMFEKSLSNTCNISEYNTAEIERYIPAIVFGMYDGFYMYAPSGVYNSDTDKTEYKHNLRNYVYYSETLEGVGDGNSDITIIYSLDNYVIVSGDFKNDSEGYIIKEGYLIDTNESNANGTKYKGLEIKEEDIDGKNNRDAIKYYKEAYKFTNWFNENVGKHVKDNNNIKYLEINTNNDPENESSLFVQHKRKIIKNKIEGVLNSSITAYSERTFGNVYKMPKLGEEDWQKIYSNISMITFFQGKNIGLKKYNGYCVLNSTNSNEYVNQNLMYFIDGREYHDIRCTRCKEASQLNGYKIGAFRSRKVQETNAAGETIVKYVYDHEELACYECVNGSLNTNKSVYEYIWELGNTNEEKNIKTAYWTSLARERYNMAKILGENSIYIPTPQATFIETDKNYKYEGEQFKILAKSPNERRYKCPRKDVYADKCNIFIR